MAPLRAAGAAAALLGLAILAYGALAGSVRVGFFLVFPYVVGTGLLPFLGTLLVMGGLIAFVLGGATRHAVPPAPDMGAPEIERSSRSGGVVLLGPIPIVWGSDRRVLPWMVGAGLALTLLLIYLATR